MADRLGPRVLVRVARWPVEWFSRRYWDLEVSGAHHVPKTGPVVVAANHFSHVDPPIITHVVRRNVRYLAVDELFGSSRFFDRLTGFFGAIPTDREGAPIGALRVALDHLGDGGVMGVFPEGTRVKRWGERSPKSGAAWLCWMTGAPLVPIAVHGTDRTLAPGDLTFRRTSVRVWVGEPLVWHEYADRVDPLAAMMSDWAAWVGDRLVPWWPANRPPSQEE